MTDARYPDRWLSDRRFQRLSDSHHRAYINALTWSVSNRTDGVIEPDDLDLIPQFDKTAVRAFMAAGLWSLREDHGRGWQITDFAATQTTAAEIRHLEDKRAKERMKKARQRAASKAEVEEAAASPDVVPGDFPGEVPADCTGKDRQGKDRQGREGELLPKAAGAEHMAWHGPGPNPYQEYN